MRVFCAMILTALLLTCALVVNGKASHDDPHAHMNQVLMGFAVEVPLASMKDSLKRKSPDGKIDHTVQEKLERALKVCVKLNSKGMPVKGAIVNFHWHNTTILRREISKIFNKTDGMLNCTARRVKEDKLLQEVVTHSKEEVIKKKIFRVCGQNFKNVLTASMVEAYNNVSEEMRKRHHQARKNVSLLDYDESNDEKELASEHEGSLIGSLDNIHQAVETLRKTVSHIHSVHCQISLLGDLNSLFMESPLTNRDVTCDMPFDAMTSEERQELAKKTDALKTFDALVSSDRIVYGVHHCDDSLLVKHFVDVLRDILIKKDFL